MRKIHHDNNFLTSNFYLAAFLFAKGFELVGIHDTGTRRSDFVFVGSREIEKTADCFFYDDENSPETRIDVRAMTNAIRNLKDKLYRK